MWWVPLRTPPLQSIAFEKTETILGLVPNTVIPAHPILTYHCQANTVILVDPLLAYHCQANTVILVDPLLVYHCQANFVWYWQYTCTTSSIYWISYSVSIYSLSWISACVQYLSKCTSSVFWISVNLFAKGQHCYLHWFLIYMSLSGQHCDPTAPLFTCQWHWSLIHMSLSGQHCDPTDLLFTCHCQVIIVIPNDPCPYLHVAIRFALWSPPILHLHVTVYSSQYGFRKGHSTELAALELVDRIIKYMDEMEFPIRDGPLDFYAGRGGIGLRQRFFFTPTCRLKFIFTRTRWPTFFFTSMWF